MSEGIDKTALSPEERLRAAVKIFLAGATRSAASKVYDIIQTQENVYEDNIHPARADQARNDAA